MLQWSEEGKGVREEVREWPGQTWQGLAGCEKSCHFELCDTGSHWRVLL